MKTASQKHIKLRTMASIFGPKAPKQPDYKTDLLNTETSILKRLNTFIDESTNKWKSTNDWIKKTGEQVNELLKRTFDVQRKVEGQMIELENKSKQSILDYDAKIERFEDHIEEKFATNDRFDEISAQIYSAVKKMDKKINAQSEKTDNVGRQIPKDTVKKAVMEEVVSEMRSNIEKVANAIPQNVAKNDFVAEIRRELFAKLDGYSTTDALKSVQAEFDSKVKKVADVSSSTTRETKKTRTDFDKVASKVKDIQADYLPKNVLPTINKEIKKAKQEALQAAKAVKKEIPTDFASVSDVEVLKEFQRDIINQFNDHKTTQNESIAVTMSNIEQIMGRTSTNVEKEIEAFKKTLAETTMGEDANFMKNIIRDLADEEIKQMRNANQLFQENVKNNIIEMKNQNRNIANKVAELQTSFDKLLALAQNR